MKSPYNRSTPFGSSKSYRPEHHEKSATEQLVPSRWPQDSQLIGLVELNGRVHLQQNLNDQTDKQCLQAILQEWTDGATATENRDHHTCEWTEYGDDGQCRDYTYDPQAWSESAWLCGELAKAWLKKYCVSTAVSVLLVEVNGSNLPSVLCLRTAPIPRYEASVQSAKGKSTTRWVSWHTEMKASFEAKKAELVLSFHLTSEEEEAFQSHSWWRGWSKHAAFGIKQW